jgi:acyl-CoA thioester hydrolase
MSMTEDALSPEDFEVSCEAEVRFRDVDAMGHVNNAVYATYFEIARSAYARSLGLGEGDDADIFDLLPFILLEVYCRFVSPVRMEDRLRAHIRCSRLGTKSYDFEYLITSEKDGRTVATGRSTQVYYDYAARRTVPVPDEIREAIIALDQPQIG